MRARRPYAPPPRLIPTPAPTRTKALPKRHDKRPTRESGGDVDVEWGRLRRPGWRGKALTGAGRGRRKRPLPARPFPRPYGTKSLPEGCYTLPTRVEWGRLRRPSWEV